MTTKEKLLLENKAWAQERLSLDKEYFKRLSQMPLPEILWIGSSDSMVPIKEITNTEPGEIIAYRNFGNLVREDDKGLMSLIEYSIKVLKTKYIIVCGYSHCQCISGSIKYNEREIPGVTSWLKEVNQLYKQHKDTLAHLKGEALESELAKINVKAQIEKLRNLDLVQEAWKSNTKYPKLVGWFYNLNNGLLEEVIEVEAQAKKIVTLDSHMEATMRQK